MRFFCSGASSSSSNGPALAPAQWQQMNFLHENSLRAMAFEFGYQNLTDVQRQVLPACLDFSPQGLDRDILVRARTGTGKTLAFLLPTMQPGSSDMHEARSTGYTPPSYRNWAAVMSTRASSSRSGGSRIEPHLYTNYVGAVQPAGH